MKKHDIFAKILTNFQIIDNKNGLITNADVAQLVEQLIRNQQVAGSTPFVGFNFY